MRLQAREYRRLASLIAPPREARIVVKGKGTGLSLPLPLGVPSRVQVQAANGECWEATDEAAGVQRNDADAVRGTARRG